MGAKQRAALEALAAAPLGAAALARRTGCTHSTLRSLERRGLIRLESAAEAPRRTRVERVGASRAERVAHGGPAGGLRGDRRTPGRAGARSRPLLLHGVTGSGKTEVYLRSVAAALGARPVGDRARPRDRAHAADRRPLRGAVRRPGRGDALAALAAGALRRVVADAARRGARLRRPALGRVRALRRPRPDHRRRGARRLVQAGGRPALRRPRGRGAPRGRGGRAAGGRQRHAAAGEHAPPRADPASAARGRPASCRRWSWSGWPAPPGRSTSARARRSTTSAARGRRRSCC